MKVSTNLCQQLLYTVVIGVDGWLFTPPSRSCAASGPGRCLEPGQGRYLEGEGGQGGVESYLPYPPDAMPFQGAGVLEAAEYSLNTHSLGVEARTGDPVGVAAGTLPVEPIRTNHESQHPATANSDRLSRRSDLTIIAQEHNHPPFQVPPISEEHLSVLRTTDWPSAAEPHGMPPSSGGRLAGDGAATGRSRKRAEERAGKSTQRRARRVRRKPNETPEQWQKRVEKGKKKMSPSPVKEEPEEQLEEESEEEWTPMCCIRAEFLERLARHQELRNRRESGRNDGYSIIVKAVVERRDGNAARAEFVETEGPRLAHLVDPNGGRILDWFADGYDKEFIPMAEDPNGNIVPAGELLKTSQDIRCNTQRMLVHTDLDREDEFLLISLMGGVDYCNKDFYWDIECIEREHRSDLTHLMEEKEAAGL